MAHVLVVDDNDQVRDLVTEILSLDDHQVTACSDGELALAHLDQIDGDITLVITDLEMPSVSGPELIRRFREAGKKVPVILMSGNHQLLEKEMVQLNGTTRALQKPFKLDQIIDLIAQLLR